MKRLTACVCRSCRAFVAVLRNHAEIALAHVNRAVADGRIARLGCQTPRSRVWIAERLSGPLESSDESWGHSAFSASVQLGESTLRAACVFSEVITDGRSERRCCSLIRSSAQGRATDSTRADQFVPKVFRITSQAMSAAVSFAHKLSRGARLSSAMVMM